MKRRTFIIGGTAVAAGAGLIWLRSGNYSLANLDQRPQLQYPPLIDASSSRRVELNSTAGETDFGSGKTSRTIGFNETYLGPVIKLAKGETEVSVSNSLEQDITAHWHGLVMRGELDGGPHQPVKSGSSWKLILEIDQSPLTAWFHTHIHQRTAIDVYAGLAGGLIVSDSLDDQRGLPSTYAEDDLYLVLQDKAFTNDGKLAYSNDMMSLMHGFTADTMVVNGQTGAVAKVPKGIVRLRLLNGSNARIYRLSFSDNREMHLIASDGGYLDQVRNLNELRLAPGERAEILVDFSDQNQVALVSRKDMNSGPGGMMGRFQGLATDIIGGDFEVLAFASNDKTARITNVPNQLDGSLPSLTSTPISIEREFELLMGGGMMGRNGMGGGMMGGGMMGGFSINGRPFDHERIDFTAKQGETEKWTIRSSMLAHPFHIHGTSFQVISENGASPRSENLGWKDTVLVENEVELLVRFDKKAPETAPFMYHCHILEHEDAGMMGQFMVV
jgi:FtsP/CotA-like multicopper oxidase with cupredoxin domain